MVIVNEYDYLVQIQNKNLLELFYNKKNVEPLEELLNSAAKDLEKLKKSENNLDFGENHKEKDLVSLLDEIKTDVDDFLDIKGITKPDCEYPKMFRPRHYNECSRMFFKLSFFPGLIGLASIPIAGFDFFSFTLIMSTPFLWTFGLPMALMEKLITESHYHPAADLIIMEKSKKAITIPILAHEYTHHVQDQIWVGADYEDTSIFMEGQAIGVQRHISNLYRKKEDNEAFMYHISKRNVYEFRSSYKAMCKKLKIEPKKSLLDEKKFIFSSPHMFGNSLFSIYEAEKGPGIYKEMINGDFKFE